MKNSFTILGAATIIAFGLYFGLRERSAPPQPLPDRPQAPLATVPGLVVEEPPALPEPQGAIATEPPALQKTPGTPLSRETLDKISRTVRSYAAWTERVDAIQIGVTGRGKPLPYQQLAGVSELVCFNVRWRQFYIGTPSEQLKSGVVTREGNLWNVELGVSERTWLSYSCPGAWQNLE